jgi:predicted enzyme related to lactoylglutathione lyase
LASHDAEKSVKFFEDVFEWEIPMNERLGFYTTSADPEAGGLDGGIFTLKKAKLPFLTFFIQVEDIDAKARKIEECGGNLIEPPHTLDSGARICLFNEPSGVTFAMIQPRPTA